MLSQGSHAALSPASRRERMERERLFAAMIEEAREHGYRQSSVAQVAARAGLPRDRFEAHFAGVEQCLLQALHSLALQAHAHVLCAYYAPREGPLAARSAADAEQLLERVLACLTPIAAATSGARADERATGANAVSAGAPATPAANGAAAGAPPRESFDRETSDGL